MSLTASPCSENYDNSLCHFQCENSKFDGSFFIQSIQ
jgi:hypothetical protein